MNVSVAGPGGEKIDLFPIVLEEHFLETDHG
jgi:hypothetical protein